MKRRHSNLAAILSLLLLLVTVAAWARSYFCFDHLLWFRYSPVGSKFGVYSSTGGVCAWKSLNRDGPEKPWEGWHFDHRAEPALSGYPIAIYACRGVEYDRFGFGWAYDPQEDAAEGFGESEAFIFPYPAIAGLLGVPALLFAIRFHKFRRVAQRRARGLCMSCSYDIRATPTRCPECGHVQSLDAPAS